MRLQIEATGLVNICLKSAAGTALVNSETLQSGQKTKTFKSKRFDLTLGNNAVVLRINGRPLAWLRRRTGSDCGSPRCAAGSRCRRRSDRSGP